MSAFGSKITKQPNQIALHCCCCCCEFWTLMSCHTISIIIKFLLLRQQVLCSVVLAEWSHTHWSPRTVPSGTNGHLSSHHTLYHSPPPSIHLHTLHSTLHTYSTAVYTAVYTAVLEYTKVYRIYTFIHSLYWKNFIQQSDKSVYKQSGREYVCEL